MDEEEKFEIMGKVLDELTFKQNNIDKRIKDSKDMKEMCIRLIEHNNLTHIIFGILVSIYVVATTLLIFFKW